MANRYFRQISIEYKLSILSSASIFFLWIFRWNLIDIITFLFEVFIEIFIYLFFLVTAIISIKYLVTCYKKSKYAYIPLLIQLITIIVVLFLPFTEMINKIDFWYNLSERQKVVEMIQKGELKPNYSPDLIELPQKFRFLSKGGGEVIVRDKGRVVFFFKYRGLDSASGFIYVKEGKLNPSIFEPGVKDIIRLEEHWYWGDIY